MPSNTHSVHSPRDMMHALALIQGGECNAHLSSNLGLELSNGASQDCIQRTIINAAHLSSNMEGRSNTVDMQEMGIASMICCKGAINFWYGVTTQLLDRRIEDGS
jgi:hypothetical protein